MFNDSELARRAHAGDRDAYGMLVAAHREVAFRVAYLLTSSASEAEDATQDGFVKAYLALDSYDADRPFRPWLLQIVANEARNRNRAAGRRLSYEMRGGHRELREVTETPEDVAAVEDMRRRLLDAVNRLPEDERLVVGLRYFLQLSEAEAAAAAGIPAGTVKSRLSRALRRLRESEEVKELR